jgi:hypothetical protein
MWKTEMERRNREFWENNIDVCIGQTVCVSVCVREIEIELASNNVHCLVSVNRKNF